MRTWHWLVATQLSLDVAPTTAPARSVPRPTGKEATLNLPMDTAVSPDGEVWIIDNDRIRVVNLAR